VAAAPEERFACVKHAPSFTFRAIEACIRQGGAPLLKGLRRIQDGRWVAGSEAPA